jgi:hypothetical protein
MSANEMADDLDKFGQLFKDVAAMLRQQSDRIVALEQKHVFLLIWVARYCLFP